MIGANELYGVVRMTGVGIAIGGSRRVAISGMRLRVAVMMTVIVSEHDAHAVAIVRNAHAVCAIRCRKENCKLFPEQRKPKKHRLAARLRSHCAGCLRDLIGGGM